MPHFKSIDGLAQYPTFVYYSSYIRRPLNMDVLISCFSLFYFFCLIYLVEVFAIFLAIKMFYLFSLKQTYVEQQPSVVIKFTAHTGCYKNN